jgi:hypothetical protein
MLMKINSGEGENKFKNLLVKKALQPEIRTIAGFERNQK